MADHKRNNPGDIIELLFNSMPFSYVFWKNTNGVYLGASTSQQSMFSKEKGFIGKTIFEILDDYQTAKKIDEIDNQIMREGLPQVIEEKITTSDGETKVFLSQKQPIRDKNRIIGLIGFAIDITERKKLEDELKKTKEEAERAKEEAERANHTKNEFLANMSHDIRTPLTGIIGISALLEQEVQKPEEKEHAHWINVCGEQLLSLLNSVLDIISIGDNQEKNVNLETINISQLITNITELEMPAIKLKHLDLVIEIADSVPEFIKTDSVKLHRILLNLLGNAIKFTDKGRISIAITFQNSSSDYGQIELTVSDTGHGIAKKDIDKVFDRFYRANLSHKGKYAGFGVGLHIVQEYVSILNGIISLESIEGQGTTFKVNLPVEIVSIASSDKASNPLQNLRIAPVLYGSKNNTTLHETDILNPPSLWNSPRLLIVEDNPIALKVAESVVSRAHCQYLSAASGEQALELMKSHDFDLVLSDIGLPGISGDELAMSIRRNENPVPIIGLTAHGSHFEEQKFLSSGMNRVISKPINLRVFHEILGHFCNQKYVRCQSTEQTPGIDLPALNEELFNLQHFPLLDIEAGIKTTGSIDTLKDLLMFMLQDDLPKDMAAIKKAHNENNWGAVEKLAHKMKSSALYCGITRMKFACQYLERYQKTGQNRLQNDLYLQLMNVIEQTMKVVEEWLDKPL